MTAASTASDFPAPLFARPIATEDAAAKRPFETTNYDVGQEADSTVCLVCQSTFVSPSSMPAGCTHRVCYGQVCIAVALDMSLMDIKSVAEEFWTFVKGISLLYANMGIANGEERLRKGASPIVDVAFNKALEPAKQCGAVIKKQFRLKQKESLLFTSKDDILSFRGGGMLIQGDPHLNRLDGVIGKSMVKKVGDLLEIECDSVGALYKGKEKCPYGKAIPTKSGEGRATWEIQVGSCIHTVSSNYALAKGLVHGKDQLLKDSIESAFAIAERQTLTTLAMPVLTGGTLVGKRDKEQIIKIIVDAINEFACPTLREVHLFSVNDEEEALTDRVCLKALGGVAGPVKSDSERRAELAALLDAPNVAISLWSRIQPSQLSISVLRSLQK